MRTQNVSRKVKIIFPLLSIAGALYLVFASSILKVTDIKLIFKESIRIDKEAFEDNFIRKVENKNIFFLKTEAIEEALRQEFLPLEALRYKKVLPNRLEVEVAEREPLLQGLVGERIFLVDKSGLIFTEEGGNEKLPSIMLEEHLTLGSIIESEEIRFVLRTLISLGPENVKEVSLKDQGIVTLKLEQTDIYLSMGKDITEQLDILREIQDIYRKEGKSLKRVDLRFQRPIIEY